MLIKFAAIFRRGAVLSSLHLVTLTLQRLFPKSPLLPNGRLSLCLKRGQLDGMPTVVPGDCLHGERTQKAGVQVPLSMALFHSLPVIIPTTHFHMHKWPTVNSTCACHEVWAQHQGLFLLLPGSAAQASADCVRTAKSCEGFYSWRARHCTIICNNRGQLEVIVMKKKSASWVAKWINLTLHKMNRFLLIQLFK